MFTHALPRRITIALCAFLLTLVLLPAGAQANSPARQSLETATNRILNFIKNPDYVNPATRGPIRQQIEDEVLHIFDFSEFSSRTVGPRWRNFTPEQKREFSNAFADLLINTYLNRIDGYNGEQVLYTGEVSSAKGDRTEVRTVVTMKDGKWLVYDVLIENISLVKNYRTQFQDILNTGSPENLIARIKAKAMEVRQENGK